MPATLRALDDAAIGDLTVPRAGRWILAAAVDWAVIVLCFAVARRVDHPVVYALVVLPIASRQQALGALFHDAAHRLVCRNHALNDVLGSALGAFPLGLTLGGYRRYHFAHHRWLGTDQDPENTHKRTIRQWALPARAGRVTAHFAGDLVGGGVPHLVAAGQLTRPVSVIETMGIAVYWMIGIGLAYRLGALWIPMLWVASIATVFWSGVRLRIWTEHLGTRDTHRIHVPLWLELFLMPHDIGMHWEHHHYPAVPFYNLGRLRRRLLAGEGGAPPILSFAALLGGFRGSAPLPSGQVGETVGVDLAPAKEGDRRAWLLLAHVALPLIAGALVYVACRRVPPRALAWLPIHGSLAGRVPAAITDVLPDAAWAYALTALLAIVWRDGPRRTRLLWMASAPVLAAAWELGQRARVVPGTFDPKDLVVSLAACALAAIVCGSTSKPGAHE